jgi:hypothetical protein
VCTADRQATLMHASLCPAVLCRALQDVIQFKPLLRTMAAQIMQVCATWTAEPAECLMANPSCF